MVDEASIYRRLSKKLQETDDTVYSGTVQDFLLDRLASRMPVELIQRQYRRIWGGEISEEEMYQIIENHESEIPDRRKLISEEIKKLDLIGMCTDIISELYIKSKSASNTRELTTCLTAMLPYISFFLKRTEMNELPIDSTVDAEAVLNLFQKKKDGD